jgi:hypothetical protein
VRTTNQPIQWCCVSGNQLNFDEYYDLVSLYCINLLDKLI